MDINEAWQTILEATGYNRLAQALSTIGIASGALQPGPSPDLAPSDTTIESDVSNNGDRHAEEHTPV